MKEDQGVDRWSQVVNSEWQLINFDSHLSMIMANFIEEDRQH